MKRLMLSLLYVAGLLAATVGCGNASSSADSRTSESKNRPDRAVHYPLRVVATTAQVADLVRNVGGEHVTVEALMGPSVDPHQYKATLADNAKLAGADVVFYNGLHLEGRMSDVLENMAERQPVFAVADGIKARALDRLRKPPEFEGGYDPHVWFDADLWSIAAKEVLERLGEIDPDHKRFYEKQFEQYVTELRDLDKECRDTLAVIPTERRVLVTAHDAFGYFGQAYDLEVHGLQGISTADETDVATKQKLVDLLVKRKIKAVFVESSVPPQNVENLIDLCARRGHTLIRGGELYSDAMGDEGTPEATYIGMMRYNIKTIVEALR